MLKPLINSFWELSQEKLFEIFESNMLGLSSKEANKRLDQFGYNNINTTKEKSTLLILLSQFNGPLTLLLVFASVLAFFTQDEFDAAIIFLILIISSLLSFWQERTASKAVQELKSLVQTTVSCLRDNEKVDTPAQELVLGDVIFLSAGSIIPADCILLNTNNLFINEATLTGESFPVEKNVITDLSKDYVNSNVNQLFMGTYVISGSGKAIVVKCGLDTEFGKISSHLNLKPPLNEFERGIRRFSLLLTQLVMIFVIVIFGINVYLHKPVLDSFLFALAIAVGITPELLPVIIAINLAQGAKKMAKQKVIVKKMHAIENFGSMNVLCTDKTGTISEGTLGIAFNSNFEGESSEKTLLYAFLNSKFQTGYDNPIDQCILENVKKFSDNSYIKLGEIPYDFVRKRLSVIIQKEQKIYLITKGAVNQILEICSNMEIDEETNAFVEINVYKEQIIEKFKFLSKDGLRVIAVAYKQLQNFTNSNLDLEKNLTFLGFICFEDPAKKGIPEVIKTLKEYGVKLKIISGDNQYVVSAMAEKVGFSNLDLLTGPKIRKLSDEALINLVNKIDLFAEIDPNQKERIILALKKTGNVVGYMGDGINDATALHTADVGISVNNAVDIAKESADIVLLEKDLNVLVNGVKEGRKTFANTIKYILISISANFGNMFSMSFISILLPFLPLLPKQVLAINFATDMPAITISTDNVDEELIVRPRKWNMNYISEFMVIFGIMSTLIDLMFFAIFLGLIHSNESQFQSAWFFISIITELFILLVIRTRRLFFKSMPSIQMTTAVGIITIISFLLPYTLFGQILDLIILPWYYYLIMVILTIIYIIVTEFQKKIFYRYVNF